MAKAHSAGSRPTGRADAGRFKSVRASALSQPMETSVRGQEAFPAEVGPQPDIESARSVIEEARRSGLLDGDKSEHVSFRAPPALIEAAKRETGVKSTTELGILALATLAQPDPVVAFMRRTRGRLSKYKKLDV